LFGNFAVAASMFTNSNSLPVALMQSLVMTVPSLQCGSDDDPSAMLGRALTYLVLYSSLGVIVGGSF
jgi:auxin efflux carrier family protein